MKKIPVSDITPKSDREVETYDLYAKRIHIYVKFYQGIFKNFRIVSGAIMLLLFYGSPWLHGIITRQYYLIYPTANFMFLMRHFGRRISCYCLV